MLPFTFDNAQIHTNRVDPYLSSCPPSLITDSSGFPRLATLILHLVRSIALKEKQKRF